MLQKSPWSDHLNRPFVALTPLKLLSWLRRTSPTINSETPCNVNIPSICEEPALECECERSAGENIQGRIGRMIAAHVPKKSPLTRHHIVYFLFYPVALVCHRCYTRCRIKRFTRTFSHCFICVREVRTRSCGNPKFVLFLGHRWRRGVNHNRKPTSYTTC